MRHYKAPTVEACWKIARREAEALQRQMSRTKHPVSIAICAAARDAADRIALKIRFGRISAAGNYKRK